jgi:hypothetical protein
MPDQPYADGWFSWKTLWYSDPGYQGPWRVRGWQLDGDSPVAFGESPTLSEIVVIDSTALGFNGYREVAGGSYVRNPGCYGWQVDGQGFSTAIVFQAVARHS